MSLHACTRRLAPWLCLAGFAVASPATSASEFDLLMYGGFEECAVAYPDADVDGFGGAFGVAHRCDPLPAGFIRTGGDCDDANGGIRPDVIENEPDAAFTDENCDGVDGDVDLAVFVRPDGFGSACGTRDRPCTLAVAPQAAASAGRVQLYLTTGDHFGPLDFSGAGASLRVFGGYSSLYRSREPLSPGAATRLLGGIDSNFGTYAVEASGGASLLLADLRLVSQSATGQTPAGNARSSYGARVLGGAVLTTQRMEIVVGGGAPGVGGGNGSSALSIAAQAFMHGLFGGDGAEFSTTCDNTSRGLGGDGGTNSCSASPSVRSMNAGRGGNGGTMDTDCSNPFNINFTATPGSNGTSAAFVSGNSGLRGLGGSGGDNCGPTTPGGNGLVTHGARGNAGSGFGILGGTSVVTSSGTAGSTGQNGGGGGWWRRRWRMRCRHRRVRRGRGWRWRGRLRGAHRRRWRPRRRGEHRHRSVRFDTDRGRHADLHRRGRQRWQWRRGRNGSVARARTQWRLPPRIGDARRRR